jgi:hypothetical protein
MTKHFFGDSAVHLDGGTHQARATQMFVSTGC